MAEAPRDQNHVPTALAQSSSNSAVTLPFQEDPITGRVLVDSAGAGGTVTGITVATANGFAGTSDGNPATPTLTLSTTVTGVLKGNGTAISAATPGTDYTTPTGTESLSNKTIGDTNTITIKAPNFTLQDGTDITKQANFVLSGITTGNTLAYTLPGTTTNQTLAVITNLTQTFVGNTTFSNATGAFGSSTAAGTYSLGSGATINGATRVINIGSAGVSGSTVNINIGSATAGALGTTTLGSAAVLVSSLTASSAVATDGSKNLVSVTNTGTGNNVLATKPTFIGTIQTITAMAALALDGSTGNMFTKTIGTGSTFTQSNFSTGQNFVVTVTGAFTITWFSGITWVTSGATAPTQAALTTYGFTCTGTNAFLGYLVGTQ